MVELTWVKPPNSRVGPITEAERKAVIDASPMRGEYDEVEDRESAYEMLQKRTTKRAEAAAAQDDEAPEKKKAGGASRSDGFWTTVSKTVIRTVVPAGDPCYRAADQARHARRHQALTARYWLQPVQPIRY